MYRTCSFFQNEIFHAHLLLYFVFVFADPLMKVSIITDDEVFFNYYNKYVSNKNK